MCFHIYKWIKYRIIRDFVSLKAIYIILSKGGSVGFRSQIQLYGDAQFGNNVKLLDKGIDRVRGLKILVHKNGHLTIGNNSGISQSSINCVSNITIGDNVNIGSGCLIMDTNFHSLSWKDRLDKDLDFRNATTAPVVINDNVFIGAYSIICKGVHIGNNSIVAAGSVVIKDIPQNQIWGGNPAKYIMNCKEC